MLGKLIKYEFKATYKFMTMLYAILLIVSLLSGIGNYFGEYRLQGFYAEESLRESVVIEVFRAFMTVVFVIMMFAVIGSVFFYYMSRFKKTLLGDAGYLYHTLPVKVHDHIISKVLMTVVWSLVSGIVAVISFLIMFSVMYGDMTMVIKEISSILEYLLNYIKRDVLSFVIEIIRGVLSVIVMYLMIYTSMSVGYSSNTHRAWKSVGVYVLISFVNSMISSVADKITFGMISNIDTGSYYFDIIETWALLDYYKTPGLIIDVVHYIILAVVLFFITRYFLKNKLNLQ